MQSIETGYEGSEHEDIQHFPPHFLAAMSKYYRNLRFKNWREKTNKKTIYKFEQSRATEIDYKDFQIFSSHCAVSPEPRACHLSLRQLLLSSYLKQTLERNEPVGGENR